MRIFSWDRSRRMRLHTVCWWEGDGWFFDIWETAEYLHCACLCHRERRHIFSILSIYVMGWQLTSVEEVRVVAQIWMGQKRLIKSIFNFIIWAMFLIENIRLYKGVFISNEQRAGTGHTLLALKKSFLLLESPSLRRSSEHA